MGQVIRAFRTHPWHGRAGLAQATVAAWAGLTHPQLSRVGTGPPLVHLNKLIHWTRLLQIPPHLLWFKLPGTAAGNPGKERRPRAHLGAAAGQLSVLLANLALDSGDLAAARVHARTACQLGQAFGHYGACAAARAAQSMLAFCEGRFRQALAYSQDGQGYAAGTSMAVRLVVTGEAWALARLGEPAAAVRAVARARELLEAVDVRREQHPGGLLACGPAQFEDFAASAAVWCRQPGLAQAHARAALALNPPRPGPFLELNPAYPQLDLAIALLQAGEPAEAGPGRHGPAGTLRPAGPVPGAVPLGGAGPRACPAPGLARRTRPGRAAPGGPHGMGSARHGRAGRALSAARPGSAAASGRQGRSWRSLAGRAAWRGPAASSHVLGLDLAQLRHAVGAHASMGARQRSGRLRAGARLP